MSSHREQRHLGYTPQQLFDLVADVERYPDFLPWLVAAHIRRRDGDTVWVDMEVGTTFATKSFASKAVLERPHRIAIGSSDALFDRYEQVWTFEPAENGGTMIEFRADFELHAPLLRTVMGRFLDEAAKTMVSAFKHRARQIYGVEGNPRAGASG
jgi:coenzyme Q-binding protein COQ10